MRSSREGSSCWVHLQGEHWSILPKSLCYVKLSFSARKKSSRSTGRYSWSTLLGVISVLLKSGWSDSFSHKCIDVLLFRSGWAKISQFVHLDQVCNEVCGKTCPAGSVLSNTLLALPQRASFFLVPGPGNVKQYQPCCTAGSPVAEREQVMICLIFMICRMKMGEASRSFRFLSHIFSFVFSESLWFPERRILDSKIFL